MISSEDSPTLAGIRPLPRLLNQALDSLVEKRTADFEQMFLSELQTRMFRRQPSEWFGIYLAVFVFLSGMEKDTWNLETWNIEVVSQRDHPVSIHSPKDKLHRRLTSFSTHIFLRGPCKTRRHIWQRRIDTLSILSLPISGLFAKGRYRSCSTGKRASTKRWLEMIEQPSTI